MLEIIKPGTKFDFIGRTKAFAVFSAIVAALSLLFLFSKGLNFGIDFAGGSVIQVKFNKAISLEELRQALTPAIEGEFILQNFGEQNEALIRIVDKENVRLQALAESVKGALEENFGEFAPSIERLEQVGPQVGDELRKKAWAAVLYSTVGILIYVAIRFELLFAIGAIISLIHDILISVGIYCILGKEFDLTVMAAVLTVAGYSLNDTIVVFDRMREKIRGGALDNLTWREITNMSLNETLSRTLLTSILTFIAVFCLYLVGGEVINGFALMMMLGIVIGTYSSIAIAASFVCFVRSRKQGAAKPHKLSVAAKS